jgi:hypothetical protein
MALVAMVVPSRIWAISSGRSKRFRPVSTPSVGSSGVDRFFHAAMAPVSTS